MTLLEKSTAVNLLDRGADVSTVARIMGRSPATIRRLVDEAQGLMLGRTKEYVDLHFDATKEAAKRGDARPAEWALERMGVVDAKREPTGGQAGGVTVNVGILLPGLPQPKAKVQAEEVVEGEVTGE